MVLMTMVMPCVATICHADSDIAPTGCVDSDMALSIRVDVSDSTQHVKEVVVTGKSTSRDVMPVQTLSGSELEKLRSNSIADALRYFSGMQIKDYGGVGGLKTVNVRSMGTNHTGICYDGIELGNAQNGQIDLGQFSLDNVEEISLYNGHRSALLQTASDYANAGTVYIRTRRPRFEKGRSTNLTLKAKYGASDLIRFSTLWEQRLSDNLSMSLSAEALNSSGKYKFRYRRFNIDGSTAYDTTAVRNNGDVWSVRVEDNLFGHTSFATWSVKLYTYHSERGIPGAIVNNVWRRGERQHDHNSFVQGAMTFTPTDWLTSKLTAKYAYYDTRYINRDTTQMLIDNTYCQQEMFASLANMASLSSWWSVSLSYDFRYNKLDAALPLFSYPRRYTNMLSVASSMNYGGLKVQLGCLAHTAKDHSKYQSVPHTTIYTPSAVLAWSPWQSDILTLRAFAKRSHRMPTFNDLYYTDMGNARLKPETALQYNVGFIVSRSFDHGLLSNVMLSSDVYYNSVHNKIVAYPKGQQFRWTMLNLGRVHIKGADIEAAMTLSPARDMTLTARLQYTYQQARDVTSSSDVYYNHQIPYIPWHSGSAILQLSWRNLDINYSFIYTGERYSQQENIRYNYVEPWYTSDLSASWRHGHWRVTLEVNNLLSQDYDVILNYPMPKRNAAVTLEYKL